MPSHVRTLILPVVGFTVGVVLLLGRFAPDSPAGRLIGQTVIAYDGQSAGAIAYREAAVEMIRRDSAEESEGNS